MVEVTIIGTSGIFTVKQWAKTLSMRVFNSVDVLGLLWTPLPVGPRQSPGGGPGGEVLPSFYYLIFKMTYFIED